VRAGAKMNRRHRLLRWVLVASSVAPSSACSRRDHPGTRPTEDAKNDAVPLDVKTDLAKLGTHLRIPPVAVESVAAPDPSQSMLVPPIMYRFYVYYEMNPTMWPSLENAIGASRGPETIPLPREVAKALLGSLADGLPDDGDTVRVAGAGYDTAWLGLSKSGAVRFREGLLVTAPLHLD